eukprot:jgi/Ulvmu1/2959/UM149_0042.1
MEGLNRGGAQHVNEPQSMHHDGSFARYMEFKNKKLHEQFREDAQNSRQVSSIFHGVTIHVNGVTHPSHQELKHLMAAHGGRFANYYSKVTVTHIVCDNLPDTKLKQMLKSRSALPVVQAAWVVHSIAAGKLLPPSHFAIDRLAMAPAQQQLKPFAPRADITLDKASIYSQLDTAPHGSTAATAPHTPARPPALTPWSPHPPTPATARTGTLPSHTPSPHTMEITNSTRPDASPARPNATSAPNTSPTRPTASPAQSPGHPAPPGRLVPMDPAQPAPQPSWTPEQIQSAQRTAKAMRAACDVLKGPPKSTADDPKFLETYFRASRLHFIGTWRMRIEQMVRTELLHSGRSPAPSQAPASTPSERIIMHVDMDCFFASVAVRHRPELQGVPLAVAHSNYSAGHSEISCVNYVARRSGVRADMWMASARERCPDLVVIPYEFEAYQEVSEKMYRILLRHATLVQPMSCDEAYVDVTGAADPIALADTLRTQIRDATQCNASIGIGPSILLAAMATKKAKPDGVFRVHSHEVDQFLLQQPVAALPGVGWSTRARLQEMGIEAVAQLRLATSASLQSAFGAKTAQELLRFAHGQDDRQVELPSARKSIGAEVNYGIRFATDADATAFLHELSKEVARRLDLCGARGRAVTLKLKRRKANAPVDPPKFLGHGLCDNFSKSVSLGAAVASAEAVFAAAWELLAALAVPPHEVRGVGISVAKLDGQPERGAGVFLPSDMHVSSLRSLWGKGAAAADARAGPADAAAAVVDVGAEGDEDCADVEELWGGQAVPMRVGEGIQAGAVGEADPPPGREQACTAEVAARPTESECTGAAGVPGHAACAAAAVIQQAGEPEAAGQLAQPSGSMQAIPAFDSLDMSVVDSLPAAMRLELMRAYGLHSRPPRPPQRRAARQPAAAAAPPRSRSRATPQKRTPVKSEAGAAAVLAPRKRVRVAVRGLTMSQVDEAVLAELPEEVQASLREQLPESRVAFRQVQAADELASRDGPRLVHSVHAPERAEQGPDDVCADDPGSGATESRVWELLRNCENGTVSVQVQDAHGVCVKLEQLLQTELQGLDCRCTACSENGHSGAAVRGQACNSHAAAVVRNKRHGRAAEARINIFLSGVEALCMHLHGVKLDLPDKAVTNP